MPEPDRDGLCARFSIGYVLAQPRQGAGRMTGADRGRNATGEAPTPVLQWERDYLIGTHDFYAPIAGR